MTTGARAEGPAPGAGAGMRIAVVASRFNADVTERLLEGARQALGGFGAEAAVTWAPGAFELPLAAHRLASSGRYDAVVCLGAVIRGETDHYVHVATQCAAGLQRAQLDTGIPVIFGVLTADTREDAVARAGGRHGNKGTEAAAAAVEMVELLRGC